MRFLPSFAVVLCSALTGCATAPGMVKTAVSGVTSPEKVAIGRAQQRWDALFASDFDKAYEFISPANKLTMPVTEYKYRVSSQYWRKYSVRDANCEPDLCVVRVNLDYQLQGIPLSQVVTEKWILDGGIWWYVFQG